MCQTGSLFTSVSSMVKGYNVTLMNSEESNPKTLIDWMSANYFSTSFYDWKSVMSLGFQYHGYQEKDQLKKSIESGSVALLYFSGQDRWMLCHEYDETGFIVHDPTVGALVHANFQDIAYGGVYKYAK